MLRRLMIASAAGGDPYWANVTTLLNMGGAAGSVSFPDSTGSRTWTAFGDVKIDDSLGYGAAIFDGSGDYIATTYVPDDFDWWTSDYTIEAWIYPSTLADWSYIDGDEVPALIGCASPLEATNYWSFGPRASGRVVFYYYSGSAMRVVSTDFVSANSLRHIAMSKNDSGIRLAVNGVVEGPIPVSGTPQSSGISPVVLTLGQINNRGIDGLVKAIRITKGVARYTSNFSPPPAPFPET